VIPGVVRLGDVLKLERRPIEPISDASYRMLGIYSHGKGTFRKQAILGADAPQVGLYEVRGGDFVLNITFAWEGAVAIVGEEDDGWYVSGRFPTFRIDPSQVDVRYLFYYFRTPRGREQLVRVSPGSAGRNRVLNTRRFLDLELPLPRLDSQESAAQRVRAIALATQSARQARAAADVAAAVLAGAAVKRIVQSVGGATHPLGELVAVRGGGTPSKGNPEYWSGTIPWISPKDMKSRELRDSADHISESATLESPARLLNPGCVLVVTRGMILAHTVPIAVLRVPAAINQDMKALQPLDGISAEYLSAVLWALNAELVRLVERSTHDTRKLQTDKLLSFQIPVPLASTQDEVVSMLRAVQAKHDRVRQLQEETDRELEALVPAVINQTFGEVA